MLITEHPSFCSRNSLSTAPRASFSELAIFNGHTFTHMWAICEYLLHFEKIGKGQIDDYITGEFVHPEDMLSEVEETGSGDSSGDELLVPREAIPSSLQKAVKAVKKGGKRRA